MRKHSPSILLGLGLAAIGACSVHIQAQSDVTQPGDPLIASSSNSPGSEGVANAIDNTQAKYLNFDTRTPNNPPSGFIVSPSVGVTRVVGMSIQSANDASERDPKVVTLEGSNDDTVTTWTGGNWTSIATVQVPAFSARFERQTLMFPNNRPYKHYRWTVVEVQSPNGCCMQVADVELLGSTLPSDVTTPGDALIASSSNSPGSEGVANAIDNTQAKYLNFDTRTPNNPPSGFIVTPTIGRTVVTGVSVMSANDAPERDPKTVTLEGSNDATVSTWTGGNWEPITTLSFPAFSARFQKQTLLFDNFKPYKHYRWTVAEVQSPNGCCMQVAEVELLGTGAPKDVTQPGDPLVASSSNSPGSEGVANAIDNTQAKYLNFDTRTPNNPPSGFIVTPSVGATAVTGMTIQSANDAPERDPKTVTLEGSNDASVSSWTGGTWELVTTVNVPAFSARFQTQEFYFSNSKKYKHYRWTVTEVQSPNGCCMQVADVELLAATASNPCDLAQFVLAPVDTPVLNGSAANFIVQVNGPWTLQWLKNGAPIPGASALTYTTGPISAANAADEYACAIVGCVTSQVVRASVFVPSATKSIGINFRGGGANGAPTDMNYPDDIAGVHLQAYWNNATNRNGFVGDGASLPEVLKDSDNADSTITFEFETSGTWGSGTGTSTPTERVLNGLVGNNATTDTPCTFTFSNVPAGQHSVLVYAVSPPLQFQNTKFTISGTPERSVYMRTMNSDEYKPAPGFYRGASTDPNNPTVGNFVRFDNVEPVNGVITLTFETLTTYDRETGVNGIQLLLNAPSPGNPPQITVEPQPAVAAAGSTAQLSVTATGTGLTYQWRKNGRNIPNGGHVSGATSPTLSISSFAADDEGIYSVAVFSAAGSVVSKNASARVTTYDIKDSLVGHWRMDETAGLVAANSIASGLPGNAIGTATWTSGRIGNSFSFDGATYLLVDNYTKAKTQIAGAAWVYVPASVVATDVAIFRNAEGAMDISGGAGRIVGQFELGLTIDPNDGSLRPMAAVGIGPNVARTTATQPIATDAWHHLVFSADGAQLRLFVDGQQASSIDYLADINAPDIPWISIGSRLVTDRTVTPNVIAPDATNPNAMVGRLDDIGLWTRALTANEVTLVYQAGLQGKTLSGVTITPVVDPEITGITLSGGNITITWTGGGTLYTSPTMAPGSWTTTGDSDGSYTAPAASASGFFRVQR